MSDKQWTDEALAVHNVIIEVGLVAKEQGMTYGEWQLEQANRIVALFSSQIAERDARIAELEAQLAEMAAR